MGIGIKLDTSSHDITLEDGSLSTVRDSEKVAQDIKTRLKTLRGEIILDNSYGFPYTLLFNSRDIDLSEIETIVKQFILETPDVLQLTSFFVDFDSSKRKMSIKFSVTTSFSGDESIQLEVSIL